MSEYERLRRADQRADDTQLRKQRLVALLREARKCIPHPNTPEDAEEADAIDMVMHVATQVGVGYLFTSGHKSPAPDVEQFRRVAQKIMMRAVTFMTWDRSLGY